MVLTMRYPKPFDTPRSVLEAIDTRRAHGELQRALVIFDAVVEPTQGGEKEKHV